MNEDEFLKFKKNTSTLIGLDLLNYKNTQLQRRITSLMNRHNIFNYTDYYNLLKSDKSKLEEFVNMLTINVTEFYRNEDKFQELEDKIIPQLIQTHGKNLKIWSAGCSSGAEVYSIAMILDKLKILDSCKLIASDFDEKIIERAKTATFSKFELPDKTFEKHKSYFTYDAADLSYKLKPEICSRVQFKKQDLLNGGFDKNFHLILCRNVVIYFTEEAKDVLYKNFYDSLVEGGVFFIGTTERINNYSQIGYKMISSFFYQK